MRRNAGLALEQLPDIIGTEGQRFQVRIQFVMRIAVILVDIVKNVLHGLIADLLDPVRFRIGDDQIAVRPQNEIR